MSKLRLTYAGERYFDRTGALEAGTVQPDGIALNFLRLGVPELFRRMARHAEFDVAEMSMSTLISMVSRGEDRFVGLPVFPSRRFRHRDVYVRTDGDVREPRDLIGRRVGVPGYPMTAALWIRAFLQHDHGVAPSDIRWTVGGLNNAAFSDVLAPAAPAGVEIARAPAGRSLDDMLVGGELDGIMAGQAPRSFLAGSPAVRRLFADHRAVESEYYARTGFFPIMHVVLVRRNVYEANRWIATSLVRAFAEARRVGWETLHSADSPPVTHPWWHDELEAIDRLLGDDPFRPGLPQNRAVVAAMAEYAAEQGLAQRVVDPEELFAPEVVDLAT